MTTRDEYHRHQVQTHPAHPDNSPRGKLRAATSAVDTAAINVARAAACLELVTRGDADVIVTRESYDELQGDLSTWGEATRLFLVALDDDQARAESGAVLVDLPGLRDALEAIKAHRELLVAALGDLLPARKVLQANPASEAVSKVLSALEHVIDNGFRNTLQRSLLGATSACPVAGKTAGRSVRNGTRNTAASADR